LAAVDYSGYDTTAEFDYFDYKELGDKQLEDGSYSWEASESRFG
jgi:xylan 1,4-beta-xylosidase